MRLHELNVAGTTLRWAVGFSDGAARPSVDSADRFNLPATRSWINFEGFMTNFPFVFQQNTVIQSSISIQISGEPELQAAV